jgi:hypothetical protein
VSPTYDASGRVFRELGKLPVEQRRAFLAARREFVAGLREQPPRFAPRLRVKRVQGTADVWELTFAPDGRATFRYGDEVRPGEPHVVWLRIGTHALLDEPEG